MAKVELRVLHVDAGKLWRGGQHQVWLLMRELAGQGIAQRLLIERDAPLGDRALELGIEVDVMPQMWEGSWRAPRRIVSIAREFRANVIHAHDAHGHAVGLKAAKTLGSSVRMVTTRRVDFPVGGNFFSSRKYREPGQHFIAISNGVRKALLGGGIPTNQIDVVFSGVPPLVGAWDRHRAREYFKIEAGEIAIVNVGALTDHKGHRWLIEAAPKVLEAFPNARIHFLGRGELSSTLKEQAAALGLQKEIRFHGQVEDARLKLAGFDLYVSSSHLEGLGTATLDAMLAGLPVVATAAGGVPDVVIDGETGRLVPERHAMALADGIIKALRDPEESGRLAENARRRVEEVFSAKSMAEGTLSVYRKLLEKV